MNTGVFGAGAIGALDCLIAAKTGGLDPVIYPARKPPTARKSSPAEERLNPDGMTQAASHLVAAVPLAGMRVISAVERHRASFAI